MSENFYKISDDIHKPKIGTIYRKIFITFQMCSLKIETFFKKFESKDFLIDSSRFQLFLSRRRVFNLLSSNRDAPEICCICGNSSAKIIINLSEMHQPVSSISSHSP